MKAKQLSLLFIVLFSCTTYPKETKQADLYKDLPSDFAEVLKAHGGLDKWRSFGTLEYDLMDQNDDEAVEHYILDLQNRKDLTVADSFKIGFDGEQVWVAPKRASYKGRSARFYHNLNSYFLTIPFILADPGVKYANDTLSVDGMLYDVISITFEKGVGDADADTYKMLINPVTHQMEMLLYTVTYYTGQAHEKYNALKYEDFHDVNGLLVAEKLTGYKYSNRKLGDVRYQKTFKNIQFAKPRPDQKIFNMPANAEIDSL